MTSVYRLFHGPVLHQQVGFPTFGAGLQSKHMRLFGVHHTQVYVPQVNEKGVHHHYIHSFLVPYYMHRQLDAEYEEPPVIDSPTFSGGGFKLHRKMKNNMGKFDDRDLLDLIQILRSIDRI
jgi:hypothetical protein